MKIRILAITVVGILGFAAKSWAQPATCNTQTTITVSGTADSFHSSSVTTDCTPTTLPASCATPPCAVTCPSLRSAVDFGNQNRSSVTSYCPTTIILSGTYPLTLTCTGTANNINANNDSCGDLNLYGNITIAAQNQPLTHAASYNNGTVGLTVIDAQQIQDRAIDIERDPQFGQSNSTFFPTVSLVGLEIRNGKATARHAGSDDNHNPVPVIGDGTSTYGGGVLNQEAVVLTLLRTTFASNTATFGGALANLDMASGDAVNVLESTIVSNTANKQGGGIYNNSQTGSSPGGILTLLHSTVANNSANPTPDNTVTVGGGGGYFDNFSSCFVSRCLAPITITNSILAGNKDGTQTSSVGGGTTTSAQLDCGGTFPPAFSGKNIVQTPQTLCIGATLSGDPKLGPLDNYGGTTSAMPPIPGSPAIDAADSTACEINPSAGGSGGFFSDESLVSRPVNATGQTDTNGYAFCDIGASEYRVSPLSCTKTASKSQVGLGDKITYTITVTNNGPDPSGDLVVTDPLVGVVMVVNPLPTLAVSFSSTSAQGSCSFANSQVTCPIGLLPKNSTATITFDATTTTMGTVTNTVQAALPAGYPAPCTAQVSTVVTDRNLTITKTADQTQAMQGIGVYTIVVTNPGVTDATNVMVNDKISGSFNLSTLTVSATQGTCGAPDTQSLVTCNIGTLKAGASATVKLTVMAASSGKISNTASVAGDNRTMQTSSTDITVAGPAVAPVTSAYYRGGTPLCHNMNGESAAFTLMTLSLFFMLRRRRSY